VPELAPPGREVTFTGRDPEPHEPLCVAIVPGASGAAHAVVAVDLPGRWPFEVVHDGGATPPAPGATAELIGVVRMLPADGHPPRPCPWCP
jgi:hypothetical protein